MAENTIPYVIRDAVELNLSYMPFIEQGGLFVPSFDTYALGDMVLIDLQLPGKKDILRIAGKVIWITPNNALHHVLPGIGVQFTGADSAEIRAQIESQLDNSMEVGGYTYGMTDNSKDK